MGPVLKIPSVTYVMPGAVVASWPPTQGMAGSNPFRSTIITNIL